MIQINIVSRISEDKVCFFDVIYAIHKLNVIGINDVKVLFIGDIATPTLFNDCNKLIDLFNISDRISFTQKSIRFDDMPNDIKNGYFLNFTIGDFMGYSGIESIKNGFKTIFYNGAKNLAEQMNHSVSVCSDIEALITLIAKINENAALLNKLIAEDNLKMKEGFLLTNNDRSFLNSVLLPDNSILQ